MKQFFITMVLALSMVQASIAQTTDTIGKDCNDDLHQRPTRPLLVNPHKWAQQPQVNSWESMEQASNKAIQDNDGYSLYQLAYLEYVHNYTISKLNPKTMLYKAFEIGKANSDPYLMYWVTELEGTVYFHYEYLQRRRNHAEWTDSVATVKKETAVLFLLADLNDKCFLEMKELAKKYLQCAYLKDETYGLLNFDIRRKAKEMEKNTSKK